MTLRRFSIAIFLFLILLLGAYVVSPYSPLFKGQLLITFSTQLTDPSTNAFITTDAKGIVVVQNDTDIHVYGSAPAGVLVVSAYLQYDPEYLEISANNITLSDDFSIVIRPKKAENGVVSFSMGNTVPVTLNTTKPIATIKAKTLKTGTTGVRVSTHETQGSSLWSADYPSRNFLATAVQQDIGALTISQPVKVTYSGGGGGGVSGGVGVPTGGGGGGGVSVTIGGGGGGGGGGVPVQTVVQPPQEGPCFPDTQNHPYGEDIFCIVRKAGIFTGYPDGTFGATDLIDRAQMATVLARSLMSEEQISAAFETETGMHAAAFALFPDVSIRQWYAKYIVAAQKLALVQGHEDGTYKPADNVNYAEAIKMIVSFAAKKNPEIKVALDKELGMRYGAWYIPYVRVAQTFELLTGQPMALLTSNPAGFAKREWVAFAVSKIPGL